MLQKQITLAEQTFLTTAKLDESSLIKSARLLNNKHIDYADLYFQEINSENWYLEDDIVKSGSFSINKGVGIRTISHDKTSLAFSEDLSNTGIQHAISTAQNLGNTLDYSKEYANRAISVASNHANFPSTIKNKEVITQLHNLYDLETPLNSITDQEKISLLQTINAYAKSMDPKIQQVMVSLSGVHEIILFINSEGNYLADLRPLIRLNIRVIAKKHSLLEQGTAGGGGRFANYKIFTANNFALAKKYTQQAINLAINNLEAIPAPAGNMPVVLAAGWPGILLHEAIGHGLEGDAIRKGSSMFANKLGAQVASNLCSIVDNGQLKQQRGSLNFDDEGTVTQNTILIENGILKNYLQDRLNAKLTNQQSTGNGRRQSYAYLPIPRMTNTYMLPGNSAPKEIIQSVDQGIYAVNFTGGQVDVTSGKFVFEANEAYLIENGKIGAPIKGATLIGDGIGVLQNIAMVGNDLQLDPGIGTCGKDGQSVPVGVGQPTLLIKELTVGGTNVAN